MVLAIIDAPYIIQSLRQQNRSLYNCDAPWASGRQILPELHGAFLDCMEQEEGDQG